MPAPTELTIDPAAVADVAAKVDAVAHHWRRSSEVLASLLLSVDEPGTAALLLAEAVTAMADLGTKARQVVTDVLRMEAAAGPLGLAGVVHRGVGPLHGVTDREATDAAEIAWATFRQGDDEGFLEINQRFCSDPRYAAAIAAHVSARGLAEELVMLRDHLPGADLPGADRQRATATAGLLRTLGTASVVGALPFGFGELHQALSRDEGSIDPDRETIAALAFLPAGVRWGSAFLADAARQIVVPLNDRALATGDTSSTVLFGGQSSNGRSTVGPASVGRASVGPVNDARVLILRALALSPHSASQLVGEVGFDRLASAKLDYRDAGAAMADVAIAATDPSVAGGSENARALFTWLDAEVPTADDGPPRTGKLPRQFHAAIGSMVTPWLGAFREQAFARETGLPNPIPDLPPAVTRNVLRLAAEEVASARLLTDGRLAWAAATTDDLLASAIERGAPYDGAGLQELGHILGRVDAARAWGDIRRANAVDTEHTETRDLYKTLVSAMTVPFRRVSNGFGFVVSTEASRFIDDNTAKSDTLEHTADGLIAGFANDAQTAKALVLARVVRAGDQIGLDTRLGLDGLPSALVQRTADGGWHLVPPGTAPPSVAADFEAWLASNPAGTAGVRTMLTLVGNGYISVKEEG